MEPMFNINFRVLQVEYKWLSEFCVAGTLEHLLQPTALLQSRFYVIEIYDGAKKKANDTRNDIRATLVGVVASSHAYS